MKTHTAYLTNQVAAEVRKSCVALCPDVREAQPRPGAGGPRAAASTSGTRGKAALGPAPIKDGQRRKRVVIKVMGE